MKDPYVPVVAVSLALAIGLGGIATWAIIREWRARRARRLGIKPTEKANRKPNQRLGCVFWIIIIGGIILGNVLAPGRPGQPNRKVDLTPLFLWLGLAGVVVALLSVWITFQILRHNKGVKRARERADSGDVEGAIADLRAEIDAKGPSTTRANGLGMLYVRQERWAEAYDCFVEAERLGGHLALHLANQAVVLAKMGRREEAVSLLEEACSLEPRSSFYRYQLCQHLADSGRFEEAREQFQRAKMIKGGLGRVALPASMIDELRQHLENAPDAKSKDPSGLEEF